MKDVNIIIIFIEFQCEHDASERKLSALKRGKWLVFSLVHYFPELLDAYSLLRVVSLVDGTEIVNLTRL